VLVLSWRFWLRHHGVSGWRLQFAQRLLDNLVVRGMLSPFLWVIDRRLRKGSVVTVVAQPVETER
jgi:hypothetical protein